jgi:hypothetical protein
MKPDREETWGCSGMTDDWTTAPQLLQNRADGERCSEHCGQRVGAGAGSTFAFVAGCSSSG